MVELGDVDLYEVLGVGRDATAGEIRRAYRRLARQHHPDLNPHPDGPRRFAMVAEAYEILHDPAQRARYDHVRPAAEVPPRSSRPQQTWHEAADGRIMCGILELSREEAALVTRHQLRLRDEHGQTIVLPAGTRHGDRLAVLHHGHPAVLIVRLRKA